MAMPPPVPRGPEGSARARRRGAIARRLAWLGGVAALLLGALLAALTWGPHLMRERLAAWASDVLGRTVSVARIDVSPFAGRIVLSDVAVAAAEPGPAMFAASRATIEIDPLPYLRGLVVVRGVQLDAPSVRAIRIAPRRFDFSDVIERFDGRPASQRKTVWRVDHVGIADGALALDDRVVNKTTTLDVATLALRGLTNQDAHADQPSTLDASMKLDGRPVVVKARATPFAERPAGDLDLRIDALPLASVLPYLPLPADVRPASGAIDVDVRAGWRPEAPQAERAVVEGRVAVTGVSVRDAGGRERAGADAIEIALAASNPIGGALRIASVAAKGARLDTGRDADGALVWPALAAAAARASAPDPRPASAPSPASAGSSSPTGTARAAGPRSLRVDTLAVEGARIAWRDAALPAPLELRVEPLTLTGEALEVPDLARPRELRGRVRLAATLEGATLTAEASAEGRTGRGAVELAGLELARYARLAGPALRARVERGTLAARAALAWDAAGPTASVTDGGVQIAGLRLVKDDSTPAEIDRIALSGLQVDPQARALSVGSATLADGRIAARRGRDGRIDLQDWYVPPRAAASATRSTAAPSWTVRVAKAEVSRLRVDYDDLLIAKDRKLPRVTVDAQASDLTLDASARVPFEASLALADGSRMSARGTLRPAPLDLDARLRLQRMTVTHVDPYLEPFVNVALASGQVWSSGRLRVTGTPRGDVARIGFDGELSFNEFRAIDKQTSDDFVRWSALAMPSVKVDWRTDRPADSLIEIGAVAFVDFYARVILGADGRLNVSDIVVDRSDGAARRSLTDTPQASAAARSASPAREPRTAAAAAPTPEELERVGAIGALGAPREGAGSRSTTLAERGDSPRPTVRVGTVRIASGNVNFTDLFIRPNYTANLTQLVGSIDDLASDRTEPSDVLITGRVDDDTPLEITGKVAPLSASRYIDLRAVARGFDLPKLSPYSGRWAGYAIEKGKLTADVRYRIEGDTLAAENKLVINQLTFGDKIDSPDATSLPVRLAVSLLKDRNGNIDLDVPISGTISDPQFSVGGLLWRAIGNLIVKVVSAPFTLLASLGGADAAELSHIAFPAGVATLDDEDRSRLDALARALRARPELSVEIAGVADPEGDRAAMQRERLERTLRGAKLAQMRRANPGAELPPISEVTLGDGERAQLLERAWRDAKLDAGATGAVPPPEELERRLIEASPIATEDVKQIAQQRARAARDDLRDRLEITNERLFLLAPRIAESGDTRPPARTDFSIK
jgi:uncharacterized protein involved in outer membrane biogenesis